MQLEGVFMKVMEETHWSPWSAMTAARTAEWLSMPVSLECHNAVEHREKIYVLQGNFAPSMSLKKTTGDVWPPMTVPRIQGLAAVYKDSIYYILDPVEIISMCLLWKTMILS